MVRAGGDRDLRHRYRANRLALRNPGTVARFGKILRGTGRLLARGQGLQIRNRDRSEGRQSVLHRRKLHNGEGAMNRSRPSRWSEAMRRGRAIWGSRGGARVFVDTRAAKAECQLYVVSFQERILP